MSRIIGRPQAGWPTQSPLPAQQAISLFVRHPGHTKQPTQWVLGVKGFGRELDLLHPPRAEVKNAWSYTFNHTSPWLGG